jgi:hypothetical protein
MKIRPRNIFCHKACLPAGRPQRCEGAQGVLASAASSNHFKVQDILSIFLNYYKYSFVTINIVIYLPL